jgi:hypothetical protein
VDVLRENVVLDGLFDLILVLRHSTCFAVQPAPLVNCGIVRSWSRVPYCFFVNADFLAIALFDFLGLALIASAVRKRLPMYSSANIHCNLNFDVS